MRKTSIAKSNYWRTTDSIFSYLKKLIDENGELEDPFIHFPTKENSNLDEIQLVPGFLDTLVINDDSAEGKELAVALGEVLENIAKSNSDDSKEFFYESIIAIEQPVAAFIDLLLEEILLRQAHKSPNLLEFAKDLAFRTTQIKTVKMGIAILGVTDDATVIPDLKILGAYDEFTSFVAVTIDDLLENPVEELWDLAKKVNGWGRIQTIEQMVDYDLSYEIKEWLITEGFRNYIMNEYLTLLCAQYGDLNTFLKTDNITLEMYNSITDLLEGLFASDAPNGNIYDYNEASSVIQNYLRHSFVHGKTLKSYFIISLIKEYLSDLLDKPTDSTLEENGWERDEASNSIIDAYQLMKQDFWTDLIQKDLDSKDESKFYYAKIVAESLELDIWEFLWKRLIENPQSAGHWDDIRYHIEEQHIDDVIMLAEENLTWDYENLSKTKVYIDLICQEIVVMILENFPGKGESLIIKALESENIRLNGAALITLEHWKLENCSDKIKEKLEEISRTKSDKTIQKNINNLLNGKSMDWNYYALDDDDIDTISF
ncbi:MAG: hypothetical protein WC994_01735 [Brumimicrobium sp.]